MVPAEEVFELKVPLPDVVAMQCRQPSLEGTGEIKLRPSRIVVGEVRQEESLDLLIVLNCNFNKSPVGTPIICVGGSGVSSTAIAVGASADVIV